MVTIHWTWTFGHRSSQCVKHPPRTRTFGRSSVVSGVCLKHIPDTDIRTLIRSKCELPCLDTDMWTSVRSVCGPSSRTRTRTFGHRLGQCVDHPAWTRTFGHRLDQCVDHPAGHGHSDICQVSVWTTLPGHGHSDIGQVSVWTTLLGHGHSDIG